MRIVFIGSVEFSNKALEKLFIIEANVVGVCTKEQSIYNADFTDLSPLCNKYNIPCEYVTDINSAATIKWIRKLEPDIIFCFGWSSLIKTELLQLAPMGIIGYHPAKLPENRGRHPLIWALALGLTESASTFFFMDEGADSGDILSQSNFDITSTDNAGTLYKKMTATALEQIVTFTPKLQSKNFTRGKQNHQLANTWRKRGKNDGLIDFRMSSLSIYNLVRALTKPYVGAHLSYKGQDIKVWKAEVINNDQTNIEPGKILDVQENSLLVKTSDGAIKLSKHDFTNLPKEGDYL